MEWEEMTDYSKHVYSPITTLDVDHSCFCGQSVHFSGTNEYDAEQKTCKNCGQVWVMVMTIVPVKES